MKPLHVMAHIGRSRKPAPAHVASVRQIVGVRAHMVLERARLLVAVSALGTLERPLVRVAAHVATQPGRRAELLLADAALVRWNARVERPCVLVQVAAPRELGAAVGAHERPFAGVPRHVVLQRTHARKLLPTDVAAVARLRGVRPHVHVEPARVAEPLLAEVARERVFVAV